MQFKSLKEQELYALVNKTLQEQVNNWDNFCIQMFRRELLITQTVRLFDEQKEINRKRILIDPNYKPVFPSPHNYGNAVDFSLHDSKGIKFTTSQIQQLQVWFNKKYPYGHEPYKSCLVHTVSGAHFHTQINMRIHGVGINQDNPDERKRLEDLIEKFD